MMISRIMAVYLVIGVLFSTWLKNLNARGKCGDLSKKGFLTISLGWPLVLVILVLIGAEQTSEINEEVSEDA